MEAVKNNGKVIIIGLLVVACVIVSWLYYSSGQPAIDSQPRTTTINYIIPPCECEQTTDHPACQLRFIKYWPSNYENLWYQNINAWYQKPCQTMKEQVDKLPILDEWINKGGIKVFHEDLNTEVFSHYTYIDCNGTEVKSYIEPLAGLSRHPYYCVKSGDYIVNKGYLTVDCNTYRPGTKAFYFDLGASTWTAGAGGASQEWFNQIYEQCGVKFIGYFMWEVTHVDPVAVFNDIPAEVIPYYHWFNIPASTEPNGKNNPLRLIKLLTKPEDFVVLKIDIDNTPVEYEFILQLLADTELLNRIDDFFWEHHVNVVDMNGPWGTSAEKQTLNDSYNLFRSFRNAGIRAHSWV